MLHRTNAKYDCSNRVVDYKYIKHHLYACVFIKLNILTICVAMHTWTDITADMKEVLLNVSPIILVLLGVPLIIFFRFLLLFFFSPDGKYSSSLSVNKKTHPNYSN